MEVDLNVEMNLVTLGLTEPQCSFNLVYMVLFLKRNNRSNGWFFKTDCDRKIANCDCPTARQ